jgi:peptidoglycan-N-acetylmuramic acid deacetylase
MYVDKRYGEKSDEKVIYLTFDAGYENGNVEKILDVMREENVVGSFFILGNLLDKNPELVLKMVEDGNIVCNHTLTHKNLTNASKEKLREEILGLEEKYRAVTGREMSKFFRPPEGTFSEELLKNACELGYKTVFWSFAYADWDNGAQMKSDVAMKKILDNLHNGEIMLLHPTSKTNAEIMRDLIRKLKQMGYKFATLEGL